MSSRGSFRVLSQLRSQLQKAATRIESGLFALRLLFQFTVLALFFSGASRLMRTIFALAGLSG
jgi:hypothetical protein